MAQDGVQIVLSPVQLAAMLNGDALGAHERLVTRKWGAGSLFFSTLQIVGGIGLLLTPEPTMLTKAGGIVLIAHGADGGAAAIRQMWSGHRTADLTETAGRAAALHLGASAQAADWTGIALDAAVPLAVSLGLGAERIIAIRAGRISLAAEEAAGGHTIARHVGISDADLQARLLRQTGIPAASTFATVEAAEDAINTTIRSNRGLIKNFLATSSKAPKSFVTTFSKPVGRGIPRGQQQPRISTSASWS